MCEIIFICSRFGGARFCWPKFSISEYGKHKNELSINCEYLVNCSNSYFATQKKKTKKKANPTVLHFECMYRIYVRYIVVAGIEIEKHTCCLILSQCEVRMWVYISYNHFFQMLSVLCFSSQWFFFMARLKNSFTSFTDTHTHLITYKRRVRSATDIVSHK